MTNLFPRDAQDLRHAVLQALATRSLIPLTLEAVCTACRHLLPFRFDAEDALAALTFLVSLGNAEIITDEFGAEDSWKVTAKGVLCHERNTKTA
jgi:hypothetical protein